VTFFIVDLVYTNFVLHEIRASSPVILPSPMQRGSP
jgi:hypothetical protein